MNQNTKAEKFTDYSTGVIENEIDLTSKDFMFSNPLADKLQKDTISLVKKYEEK